MIDSRAFSNAPKYACFPAAQQGLLQDRNDPSYDLAAQKAEVDCGYLEWVQFGFCSLFLFSVTA